MVHEDTRPCICNAWYEGCDHPVPCRAVNSGTGHGPWCTPCNERRFIAIRAGLRALSDAIEERVRARGNRTYGLTTPPQS